MQAGGRRVVGVPHRGAAHRQHGCQLGQQVVRSGALLPHQAQHALAGVHLVHVALTGRAGQGGLQPCGVARGQPGAVVGQRQVRGMRALLCPGPVVQGLQGGGGLGQTHRAAGLHAAQCGVVRAVGQQAQQVQRPTGFGAGARQALAAERLHTHHRTHDVAVDVHVARVGVVQHLGYGFVNA